MFDIFFKKAKSNNQNTDKDIPTFNLINEDAINVYDQPASNYDERQEALTEDQQKFISDLLASDITPANMLSIYFETHYTYRDQEETETYLYDIIIGKSDVNYYAIGEGGHVYTHAGSIQELAYELALKWGNPQLVFKQDFDKSFMRKANEMIECSNQINSRGLSNKIHTYDGIKFINQKWAIAYPFMKTWNDQINGKNSHWDSKLKSHCLVDIYAEKKLLPLFICKYGDHRSNMIAYLALNIKTGIVIAQAHTMEKLGELLSKDLVDPLLIAWW